MTALLENVAGQTPAPDQAQTNLNPDTLSPVVIPKAPARF
jgi:hypothetical protein